MKMTFPELVVLLFKFMQLFDKSFAMPISDEIGNQLTFYNLPKDTHQGFRNCRRQIWRSFLKKDKKKEKQ